MKFCSKCGKELHDEAVICVGCGCPIETVPKTAKNEDINEYNRLMAFVREVKTMHILGIISLVLCLGIGIIFQIINIIKLNKYMDRKAKGYKFPEFNLTNPNDIALYEDTKKKYKAANTMTGIGLLISILLIFFAFWNAIVLPLML